MNTPDARKRASQTATARRAAAQHATILRLVEQVAPTLLPATVARVDTSATPPLCWVSWDEAGTPVPAMYPDTYSPVVGHNVEVALQRGEPRILHRLVGAHPAPTPDPSDGDPVEVDF